MVVSSNHTGGELIIINFYLSALAIRQNLTMCGERNVLSLYPIQGAVKVNIPEEGFFIGHSNPSL